LETAKEVVIDLNEIELSHINYLKQIYQLLTETKKEPIIEEEEYYE